MKSEIVIDVREFPTPRQRDMDSLDRVTDEQMREREIRQRFNRAVAANEVARIERKLQETA